MAIFYVNDSLRHEWKHSVNAPIHCRWLLQVGVELIVALERYHIDHLSSKRELDFNVHGRFNVAKVLHESLDAEFLRIAHPLHHAVGRREEKLDSIATPVIQSCFGRHFAVKPLTKTIWKPKRLDDTKSYFFGVRKRSELARVMLWENCRIESTSNHIRRHIDLPRALVAQRGRGSKRVAPEFLGTIGS